MGTSKDTTDLFLRVHDCIFVLLEAKGGTLKSGHSRVLPRSDEDLPLNFSLVVLWNCFQHEYWRSGCRGRFVSSVHYCDHTGLLVDTTPPESSVGQHSVTEQILFSAVQDGCGRKMLFFKDMELFDSPS